MNTLNRIKILMSKHKLNMMCLVESSADKARIAHFCNHFCLTRVGLLLRWMGILLGLFACGPRI